MPDFTVESWDVKAWDEKQRVLVTLASGLSFDDYHQLVGFLHQHCPKHVSILAKPNTESVDNKRFQGVDW